MILNRQAWSAVGLTCAAGCAGAPPQAPPPPRALLHLEPLVDVVPAARLEWLVDARPSALVSDGVLGPALASVISSDRFAAFAETHGGLDLRVAPELVVAGYPDTTLALVEAPLAPDRVLGAFRRQGFEVEVEPGASSRGVARLGGTLAGRRAELAILGGQGVALAIGRVGLLEAALYFAEDRLKRAAPALRAEPLATVAAQMPPWTTSSPLRGFAAGPFEGTWSRALGGLLGAATGVGASVTALEAVDEGVTRRVVVTVVLAGAWAAADERGSAATDPRRATGPERNTASAGIAAPSGDDHGHGGGGPDRPRAAGAPWADATASRDGSSSGRTPVKTSSADAAGERLEAAFELLAEDSIGRLCGLDRPLAPVHVTADRDALRLEVTLDAAVLAEGLRSVVGADFGL